VAPFAVSLINLRASHEGCEAACETLYQALKAKGISVLYDDTAESAGSKLATHDLIGMPLQVIIGPRGLEQGAAELKYRKDGVTEMVPLAEIVEKLAAFMGG
jgi:prolyl-tRNA synthetase